MAEVLAAPVSIMRHTCQTQMTQGEHLRPRRPALSQPRLLRSLVPERVGSQFPNSPTI